jgi:putative Mn2+ efflux pump MntP
MLKLLAFVLPLGLDSFAVTAAIGAAGVTTAAHLAGLRDLRRRNAAHRPGPELYPCPGRPLAAGYLAGAAVIAIGAWMLLSGDNDEEEKASRITTDRGLALVALGISLDELAIGFTIGLARLPVTAVIVALALQAFAAAQLGLALGTRIGERWRERAERAARLARILLGAYLITERLAQ